MFLLVDYAVVSRGEQFTILWRTHLINVPPSNARLCCPAVYLLLLHRDTQAEPQRGRSCTWAHGSNSVWVRISLIYVFCVWKPRLGAAAPNPVHTQSNDGDRTISDFGLCQLASQQPKNSLSRSLWGPYCGACSMCLFCMAIVCVCACVHFACRSCIMEDNVENIFITHYQSHW